MPFDLDIGVIYTHERPFMPKLLDSLAQSGEGLTTRLLLVDNASIDGAGQWRAYFPEVEIVRNTERLHYAANLNRILAASDSRYTLLLNTDMYFDPSAQCLAAMVEFMERQPRCGLSGCRLLHADGQHAPSARRFQTVPIILARRLGLSRIMPGTVRDYFYAEQPIEASYECDWLSGCFLLLRREAASAVGPFDEQFVKYFEDVDICLRMARAEWQVMYHGATYCYHLEQRASKRLFSPDARRHLRSYLRWLMKWGFRPQRRAA